MHPELFKLGQVTIYSYGVCVALGFLAAIVTAASRARRYGWKPEVIYDLSLYVLIAALVGSRLLYVLANPEEFAGAPWEVIMIWKGGLVFYGGLIAAVLAAIIYLKMHRLNIAECFDLLIPSVALGHAIGRVGCLLNGCCFGRVSFMPWAVTFPKESLAYYHQLYEAGYIPPGSESSLPVHPAQIYGALMELLIFVILSIMLPRKRFNGQIFWMYFLLYGTGRFFLEFLRADNPPVMRLGGHGLDVPQIMSFMAVVVSSLILFRKR